MSPVDDARATMKGKRRPPQLLQSPPEEPQTPFQVRNTFIDTSMTRSPSLENFFEERKVQTCPSSCIGMLQCLFQDEEEEPKVATAKAEDVPPWRRAARAVTHHDLQQVKIAAAGSQTSTGSSIATSASDGQATPPPLAPPAAAPRIRLADAVLGESERGQPARSPLPPGSSPQAFYSHEPVPFLAAIGSPVVPYMQMEGPSFHLQAEGAAWQPPPQREGYAGRPVVPQRMPTAPHRTPPAPQRVMATPRRTPAPPTAPAPGSTQLPTRGSAGHNSGRCKPCAFVHTTGCSNGAACEFCHLCDPGEKKRRRKEKLEARKMGRDLRARRPVRS